MHMSPLADPPDGPAVPQVILGNEIVRLHFRKFQCSFHVMREARAEMLEQDLVNIANPLQQVAGRGSF